MKRGVILLALAAFAVSLRGSAGEEQGFMPLYNGKDLSGWAVKGGNIASWKADGELLACVAGGGGWLRTEKEYANFVLRLDWRIPKGGNSGVGLRFPLEGDPAHDGMEIQILDDDAHANLKPAQYTGGIYYQVAPKQRAAKPVGEWNHYEIVCDGPEVFIDLNGVRIIETCLDEQTQAQGNYKPLSQRPRRGFIGLQSHGSRVDFRNLQIKVLP